MRAIRDMYGRRCLVNTNTLPSFAMPYFVQDTQPDGPYRVWGWQLIYSGVRIYVDHALARELINDGSDLDAIVKAEVDRLNAEIEAGKTGKPTVIGFN